MTNGLVNGVRILATAILSELEQSSHEFISTTKYTAKIKDNLFISHLETVLVKFNRIDIGLNNEEFVIIGISRGNVKCLRLNYYDTFYVSLNDLNINQLCQLHDAVESNLKI